MRDEVNHVRGVRVEDQVDHVLLVIYYFHLHAIDVHQLALPEYGGRILEKLVSEQVIIPVTIKDVAEVDQVACRHRCFSLRAYPAWIATQEHETSS